MLAVQDSQADANYFADLANIAKGGLTVQSSTGTSAITFLALMPKRGRKTIPL